MLDAPGGDPPPKSPLALYWCISGLVHFHPRACTHHLVLPTCPLVGAPLEATPVSLKHLIQAVVDYKYYVFCSAF